MRERGSANVLVLALTSILALVAVTVSALFAVAVAVACGRATELAERTGGVVLACTLDRDSVQVLVEVRPTGPVGRLGAARARASAGPVG